MMEESGSWQKLYKAAMLELDPIALRGRIEAARVAIREALEGLAPDGTTDSREMRAEMVDALANLETLQRLELRVTMPAPDQRRHSAEG